MHPIHPWFNRISARPVFPLSPLLRPVHLPVVKSDYDGAWKDLLHRRLPEILSCYFPMISAAINEAYRLIA